MSRCGDAEREEATESCCAGQHRGVAECPACGRRGKRVDRITPEHLLREDRVEELQDRPYYFCATLPCDMVYFSDGGEQTFSKADLKVRVGLKETEDPVPVCYCFDYTEKMIFDEIAGAGRTAIPERIRAEVLAGICECEIKNPQGTCCLGNVGRAVKRAKALTRKAVAQIQGGYG